MNNRKQTDSLMSFIFVLFAFWIASCGGNSTVVQGGGSEGGNVDIVIGIAYSPNGSRASGVQVALIPADYNPAIPGNSAKIKWDTTDTRGQYQFTDIPVGDYNCQLVSADSSSVSLLTGLKLNSDTITVPADTLQVSGGVQLRIPDTLSGYVFIPGTTWFTKVNPRDTLTQFTDLPPGMIDRFMFMDLTTGKSSILVDSVLIVSDTIVDQALFSTVVLLNSAADSTKSEPQILKLLLEKSGSSVTFVGAPEAPNANIDTADLVYLFHTVSVVEEMKLLMSNLSVPVICANHLFFYPMGLIDSYTNSGQTIPGSYVPKHFKIVDKTNSLAAGFSDSVSVISGDSVTMNYATPFPSASSVMLLDSYSALSCLFAYEKGDLLRDSQQAPARRVGTFFNTNCYRNLTKDGEKVFRAMVNWAVN